MESNSENESKNTTPGAEEALTYVAHYSSPGNNALAKGHFEFESTGRASSKTNKLDARIKMLELYGKEAVSWVIDEIKIKKITQEVCDGQLELDFRDVKPVRKRRVTKKYL